MKPFLSARNVKDMAGPVQDIVAHFDFKMKVPVWLAAIALLEGEVAGLRQGPPVQRQALRQVPWAKWNP